MIPSLILAGLLLGRWWRVVIPVAILAWPALLIGTGVDSGIGFATAAAAIAAPNVIAGVLLHQALRSLMRPTVARRRNAAARH